jgi:hypothetical protein
MQTSIPIFQLPFFISSFFRLSQLEKYDVENHPVKNSYEFSPPLQRRGIRIPKNKAIP